MGLQPVPYNRKRDRPLGLAPDPRALPHPLGADRSPPVEHVVLIVADPPPSAESLAFAASTLSPRRGSRHSVLHHLHIVDLTATSLPASAVHAFAGVELTVHPSLPSDASPGSVARALCKALHRPLSTSTPNPNSLARIVDRIGIISSSDVLTALVQSVATTLVSRVSLDPSPSYLRSRSGSESSTSSTASSLFGGGSRRRCLLTVFSPTTTSATGDEALLELAKSVCQTFSCSATEYSLATDPCYRHPGPLHRPHFLAPPDGSARVRSRPNSTALEVLSASALSVPQAGGPRRRSSPLQSTFTASTEAPHLPALTFETSSSLFSPDWTFPTTNAPLPTPPASPSPPPSTSDASSIEYFHLGSEASSRTIVGRLPLGIDIRLVSLSPAPSIPSALLPPTPPSSPPSSTSRPKLTLVIPDSPFLTRARSIAPSRRERRPVEDPRGSRVDDARRSRARRGFELVDEETPTTIRISKPTRSTGAKTGEEGQRHARDGTVERQPRRDEGETGEPVTLERATVYRREAYAGPTVAAPVIVTMSRSRRQDAPRPLPVQPDGGQIGIPDSDLAPSTTPVPSPAPAPTLVPGPVPTPDPSPSTTETPTPTPTASADPADDESVYSLPSFSTSTPRPSRPSSPASSRLSFASSSSFFGLSTLPRPFPSTGQRKAGGGGVARMSVEEVDRLKTLLGARSARTKAALFQGGGEADGMEGGLARGTSVRSIGWFA